MTENEWLSIGYDKGIIDINPEEEITFNDAYKKWFCMKMGFNRPPTMDRIEVTYNRYYACDPLFEKYISKITDNEIIHFLMRSILSFQVTYKELGRIMQIVTGTLNYMRDTGIGGCPLHDWEKIKRNLPLETLESGFKQEHAIKPVDVQTFLHKVIKENVYPEKYNTGLCLCMNFYLGLRIGELASLQFDDFDFERGVVKITKTESKSYTRDTSGEKIGTMVYTTSGNCKTVYSVREIPILPETAILFEKIRKNHDANDYKSPLLCYDGKDVIAIRQLDRTLRRICDLSGIGRFNSHMIRKTFGTIMHFNGVPTRVISDLMGHSEIGTTENSYILSFDKNYEQYREYMRNGLKY